MQLVVFGLDQIKYWFSGNNKEKTDDFANVLGLVWLLVCLKFIAFTFTITYKISRSSYNKNLLEKIEEIEKT